ncbi:MAG: 50S ribosomal protein L24 [Oligoflexales bacterium]|nr:50S ribosomal protein L24 [Oligoflexales bacterium]
MQRTTQESRPGSSKSKQDLKTKLLKGDEVVVLTGRSRGLVGKIEKLDKKNARIFVAGVNVYKRHQKPTMQDPGGIVDKPMSLHISNVAFLDPKLKKPTRLGYQFDAEGKKVRVAKLSKTVLA